MVARELLIALSALISFSVCYKQPKILCVVDLDNTKNCTTLTLKFNCTACHPLSDYIKNVSEHFSSNTVLLFTKGTHCLPLSPDGATVVNVTGVSNFTMKGLGSVSYNASEEGATQPSSIISCSCDDDNRSQHRSGILFYKSNTILLENLTMEDCGANLTLQKPDNFVLKSALTFRESYNINITQIRMDRSLGFGLDADRNYGYMKVSNSAFLRFQQNEKHIIGGNARFWYSVYRAHTQFNTTLRIEHSSFLDGLKQDNEIPSAGGLTIFIYLPNTMVSIDHIKAINNTGNVAITIFDHPENTSAVTIRNSIIAKGSAIRGAGIRFWIKLEKASHNITTVHRDHSIVMISNTTFLNNLAKEDGGGLYISHYEGHTFDNTYRYIDIQGCHFIGNYIIKNLGSSSTGAAVQIFNHKITDSVTHVTPLFFFTFAKCTFAHNKVNKVANKGGIVNIVLTSGIVINNSNFTSNEGTAISLRNSNLELRGHIVFKNNTGMNGGALKFCQFSKMILPLGRVLIDFINNSATSMGGAIYVAKEQCVETLPPCFFQPVVSKKEKVTLRDVNVTLRFSNNSARLAGDAVYGGQVDACYVVFYFYLNGTINLSQQLFDKLFNFAGQMNSTNSTVSSTPYGGCFCNTSDAHGNPDTLSCGNMIYHRQVLPGQTISIGVAAIGQRNGTVPTRSVYFDLRSGHYEVDNTSQININNPHGGTEYRARCVVLNCTLYSDKKREVFTLKLQQVNPTDLELRYGHYQDPKLTVSIGDCPWGFKLTTYPPYMCICDDLITGYNISCNIDIQILVLPGGHFYWLGCSTNSDRYVNANDTKPECRGLSLADHCLLGYCKTATLNISPETLNKQCSDGREGVLCGRCKQNHCLALGTSRCLPKFNCHSYLFYIILVVCAASGILLILFLIACNFTVSEGTINGLFFYAHVVHRNSGSFFPSSVGTFNANIFRLLIAWLNLDLGFEVCFYKSMSQYQKTWMQFGFLCYVWLLELFIIILSRRYIFFTRLFGRNVMKVLATLFLICYAKTLNTAITTLEFTSIRHSNGKTFNVWLFDGNLGYLMGKHIPLFFVGTIFCALVLVYTMVLLFIQFLQKRSNICCLRWVDRLRPFFEAYTGPCHVNYRFWPGFLFSVRSTLFISNSIFRDKPTINLHITIAACIVILVFAFVSPNGVYKRWPLNVLEFSFIVNLGVVSGLVAIFCRPTSTSMFQFSPVYFVYPSVAVVMVLLAGILCFHCLKQIFFCSRCQKLSQLVTTRRIHTYTRIDIQRKEQAEPFLNQHMPQVAHFGHYREPLIGED